MSNYNEIRSVINKISGQQNTFTIPKIFVELTGDLTTAVLLNQIVFLSDKSKRTDGFFYKTYKEWEEEVCLTERQVRNSANKLKREGIIRTKIMKANGAPTVHYKLHYDKLIESILTLCHNPSLQNVSIDTDNESESLTETTTETKDTIPFSEIVNYLNKKTDSCFKHTTKDTQTKIRARWNEGFRLEDFKNVIDIKTEQWLGSERWKGYLRPFTLFGGKFESYLNEYRIEQERRAKTQNNRIPLSKVTDEERAYLAEISRKQRERNQKRNSS